MTRLARAALTIAACVLLAMAGTPRLAAQPALAVLRVNGVQTDDITPLIYALRTGMFRKAGLDVQLVLANNGAATAAAVASGAYEIGKSSLLALMNAHLRNLPLVVIAAGGVNDARQRPFAELVVAADSRRQDGKSFNGTTIAVSGLNDLSTVSTDAWIDRNGGDSRTVSFVEMPVSAMPEAVAGHRVDAAFILQPILAEALARGTVRAVGIPYTAIAPVFVGSGWFTTTDYAAAHADALHAFVRVMYEAAEYTNRHTAQTAPMMADLTKVPLTIYAGMPRTLTATATSPEDIQPLIDAAAKYHVIPQAFPARDLLWTGSY